MAGAAVASCGGEKLRQLRRPLLAAVPSFGRALRSGAQGRRPSFLNVATIVHAAVALLALASLHAFSTESSAEAPGAAFVMPSHSMLKQVAAPGGALLVGLVLHQIESLKIVGKLLIYFGAQTGMNLYMKAVLSKTVVSEELKMVGVPAAFLVTAMQQLTSFVLFVLLVAGLWFTPWRYTPKSLTTKKELVAVCCFSLSFAFNIGLNLFSLALLPISLNLIIRSCLPLSTAVSQNILAAMGLMKGASIKPKEFAVMLLGVFFAAIATAAKSKGSSGSQNEGLLLGVFVCSLSIFSGAINFVLAGFLGDNVKLNPLDTTCYMALPASAFLVIPILLMPHSVSWPGFDMMTDWQVFLKLVELSPSTVGLVLLSGVFAVSYNVLQYALVQDLSATYTAFAGNMNKAATVALAMMIGLESLPEGKYGLLMLFGIVGNIGCFTYYSLSSGGKGKH